MPEYTFLFFRVISKIIMKTFLLDKVNLVETAAHTM